ncbi:RNA polymerase sigma factor SigJ [Phytomonospora sp. NPDC050363]|uniref:RNA polymerase sigma factor SigJ n=1 Tax=Phytomonospora sp. NPDC050363 TaxID=3155642 RepID=UPI0033F25892
MPVSQREVTLFEAARPRLEAIAYRLLGSASDAEDAVQDTFLRWQSADREHVLVPEAWLTKVLTNLCLNQLTSARARRETYVGQWFPEPVLAGDTMLGPADTAEQRESVSMAMLDLMELLPPKERAVYVLRVAFGYRHDEIAAILDISEANSQQLHRRAKQHLADDRPRVEVTAADARRIVEEFLAAAVSGRTEPLVELLADGAIGAGDGGGIVPSLGTPVAGRLQVARFMRGLLRSSRSREFAAGGLVFAAVVNNEPALVMVEGERVIGVFSLEPTADGIAAIRMHANPEKLVRFTRAWAATEDHGSPLDLGW